MLPTYSTVLDELNYLFELLGILVRVFAPHMQLNWNLAAFQRLEETSCEDTTVSESIQSIPSPVQAYPFSWS